MKISEIDELFKAKGLEEENKFLLIAGLPLKEPIVTYGPFVMNTNQQISDTIYEYQHSLNGFEGADSWESEIKSLMK